MRKKYLSALLFGALLFASAGTFTSCKDYDDDIANLQEQLDKKASVEEIQKQIDAMKADVETAKTTAEEAKKKAEEALAKAESGQGGEGVSQADLDALKKEIEEQIAKLASLEDVDKKIAALRDELLKDIVTSGQLEALQKQVDELELTVSNIVGKVLNSLVFQPTLYVDGVEATEYAWMGYAHMKAAKSESNHTDDEGNKCVVLDGQEWFYTEAGTAEYDPIVYVNYHLNPSKAEVKKENLTFVSNDAEIVTTRTSVAKPEVAGDVKAENGILTVGLKAKGSEIHNNTEAGNRQGLAPIFALQANVKTEDGKDRVVTSDYAMLYSSIVTPKAIAFSVADYNGAPVEAVDCSETYAGNPDELYKEVGSAIGMAPSLKVAYNGEINLKDVLAIHYNQVAVTSSDAPHKVWAYGEEATYGLKYDFEYIQYTVGDNKTSDSKYADQAQIKNGIIAPRIVDSNGNTLGETGVSSVGRHPLVRVRVLDAENRVVLYAFVKVEIVRDIQASETKTFEKSANFGCDVCTPSITWAEMSHDILEFAGVTKEEFDALYKLDTYNNGSVARQFKKTIKGEVVTYEAIAEGNEALYGEILEKKEGQGTTNSTLVWTLGTEDQQRVYDGKDHAYTVYVAYTPKLSNTSNTPIYVPIKLTVAKPQGEVITKIPEYWYNNSENTRLNVLFPKDNMDTKEFIVDLNQVWKGNLPEFNPTKGFDSYTDEIFDTQFGSINGDAKVDGGYKYYFAAANNNTKVKDLDGVEYTLSVDQAQATDIFGKKYDATPENELAHALKVDAGVYTNVNLYATPKGGVKTKIATIDQRTGKITYIWNEGNTIAKKLLNAYDHSEAGLFAQIGITAYSPCGIAMSLKNSSYPAYFLRPLSIVPIKNGEFTDAHQNGSTLDVLSAFNFEDWRDKKFVDGTNYANSWLLAFYNINGVNVDIENITTTLGGGKLGETKLNSVTKQVKFSQLDKDGKSVNEIKDLDLATYNKEAAGNKNTYDAIKKLMGQIKYENNGNNVKEFQVRIPVEFTYDWGVLKASIDCKVVNTQGNQGN